MRVAILKLESKNIHQRDPQNLLHDSAEFYVQSAIKFVHEHENFRRKPLKAREWEEKYKGIGKESGPLRYFVQWAPSS